MSKKILIEDHLIIVSRYIPSLKKKNKTTREILNESLIYYKLYLLEGCFHVSITKKNLKLG